MHDDTQIARVIAMGKALRNGKFPVRWVSDLGYGYGYPIFNFYGPLPYYIGGLFYALGVDALAATKIMFAIGILSSGVTMYFLARGILGLLGGLIAATFYMYAPYHAVQIYVRGAVGEYYTLIFFPLVILGIIRAFQGKSRQDFLIGAIGLAGVVLSHTIIGYVAAILLGVGYVSVVVLYFMKKISQLNTVVSLSFMFATGLLLSAFFWLPALFEMGFTNVASQIGGSADFSGHFVCLSQLWDSPWGYAGSGPGCIDGMAFKLGKVHVIFSLLALLLWAVNKRIKTESNILFRILIVILVISIFFMIPSSKLIWVVIPGFAYIQYPWRFLTFALLPLALLPASLVVYIESRLTKLALTFFLIALVLYSNTKLFHPQAEFYRSSSEFESSEDVRWRVSKISDEYLPREIIRPTKRSDLPIHAIPKSSQWYARTEVDTETYSRFVVDSNGQNDITVLRAYFPGWLYKVNGREGSVKIEQGLPILRVEDGKNIVELIFLNTPIRKLSNGISFITVFGLLYLYGRKKTFA